MRTDTWQCIVETSNKSYKSSGEGNGNPLQYSWLENSMDGEVQWATVHGVAKRWIQLSTHACIGEKKKMYISLSPPPPKMEVVLVVLLCKVVRSSGAFYFIVVSSLRCRSSSHSPRSTFQQVERGKWMTKGKTTHYLTSHELKAIHSTSSHCPLDKM